MPNTFSYLMLIAWPLVCLVMYRRLPFERAMIWSVLGGYLALPPVAEFDLPLIPALDKFSIASISAFVICVVVLGRKVAPWPQLGIARVLTVLFVFSVIASVANNGEPILFQSLFDASPIVFTTGQLPGMGLRDIFSVLASQMIMLLPFLLARQYLATETGLRELLLALAIGGLIYAVPSLLEIRLSPQTNIWIYGFFQHDWNQMIRDGGFRAIVFLPHALWLALFFVMALLAAVTFVRTTSGAARGRWLGATALLALVLMLSKSLASLAYGLFFTPVVFLISRKGQIRLAILCALIAISYPMLRNADLVPLEQIMAGAEAINPDRAQSLAFRLDNENQLLERADEKPLFGWGGWGRNLLRDAQSGEILTIPDGRWIIVFGTFGWVGYLAEMGLLAIPLLLLGWRMRAMQNQQLSPYVAPIAIILAATMIDMLLNATLIPITWMCAGAILGYAERLNQPQVESEKPPMFRGGPVIGRPSNGIKGQKDSGLRKRPIA